MAAIVRNAESLRTPLDAPFVLFVLSGLVGVWASYDPATSWFKFGMLVAAVALYYALVFLRRAPQLLETFAWFFVVASAGLAIYFVTQHDYAADSAKIGMITALGIALHNLVPDLGVHVPDPNIAAGALELAFPVGIALYVRSRSTSGSRQHASLALIALVGFGLLMTSSRGAWLALAMVGLATLLVMRAQAVLQRYALPLAAIAALLTLIAVLWLAGGFLPSLENLLGAVPAGNTWVSRVELYRHAWRLVKDYYFTGSGLGVFPMVYSTYALMIDVPFLTHAHNLLLEIWLEQGLLGFVAFAWLVVEFYLWLARHANALTWLGWAGAAAATVMFLHATVDVLLYSSRGLPLMFIPMGIALGGTSQMPLSAVGQKTGARNLQLGLIALTAFCLLLFVFRNPFGAMWYANLGSVEQTKVELGQYHFPDRLVGAFRTDCLSSSDCGLVPAIALFREASAFDRSNLTAGWRLRLLEKQAD